VVGGGERGRRYAVSEVSIVMRFFIGTRLASFALPY
jgi:hypothetical protein